MQPIVPLPDCPLCVRAISGDLLAGSEHAAAFLDAFPLNPGHGLIVPRRHVAGLFEVTPAELAAVWELVPEVIRILTERHAPDGFNLGANIGAAAGQTISHAHLHVIPRYAGDVADPRGGVRWVLPDRAAYWKAR